jgi:AcrR family transcriptional regulator
VSTRLPLQLTWLTVRRVAPAAGASAVKRQRHRGRPAKLSRDSIIHATLDLLDEVSVDRFTMSMLAKRFSVGVMTLYSYFSGRDALLIAVADEIYSRFECSVQGGPWQYQVREWLWTTVRLFERYPVAMQLSLWDGQASPGWLRTWIPLIELIKGQGLEGPQLAFAARWFTTSSLGFITSQPPPHTGRVTGHLDALTSREAILLQDLQLDMVEVDADAALTYGFTHIIAGLERIIAEANGISAGPKGIQDHE